MSNEVNTNTSTTMTQKPDFEEYWEIHPVFGARVFKKLKCPGDGNCFFHSVALALNIKNVRSLPYKEQQDVGFRMRKALITEKRWNAYLKTIDPEIRIFAPVYEEVSSTETFACDFVYNYLVHTYKFNILVWATVNKGRKTEKHEILTFLYNKRPETPTIILYHENEHFEPIVSQNNPRLSLKARIELTRIYQRIGKCSERFLAELMECSVGDLSNVFGVYEVKTPIVRRLLKCVESIKK